MGIKNVIKNVYFNDAPLTEKDYKVSRNLYIAEGTAARLIFNFTSGAFLAGFASYLGANDQFNGIIGAVPAIAGTIQIFSPMVSEKLEKQKLLVAVFCLLHRLLLGLMVFIPLLVQDTASRLALIVVFYFVSYTLGSFVSPAASGWIIDLTPEPIRGKYFGMRDFLILPVVTVLTIVLGRVMDIYKLKGSEYSGFLWVFGLVLVLALINFLLLSSIKEPPVKKSDVSLDIKSILTLPLKDKKFRRIIVLFILWNVGFQVGGPFFSVYMVTGLKLDYTYIMAVGIVSSLANLAVVRFWGRLADRKSWIYTTKVSIGLLAICHFMWFFMNARTVYILLPALYVLSGISWAGINISVFNIQFIFAPENGRTVYLGFNSALGGLVGFLSALVGSALLGIFENFNVKVFGLTAGNMQLIFAVSGLLLGLCTAYIHYFIKKHD
jgi:MFS family permease